MKIKSLKTVKSSVFQRNIVS